MAWTHTQRGFNDSTTKGSAMSDGYTKLFASITDSTIWGEPNTTRIVWITMLAMADQHGYVGASVSGLSHRARVTIDECVVALACFSAPDKWSRTAEFEGRRIAQTEGGWILLNHSAYRAKMDKDARREQSRIAMARLRSSRVNDVNSQLAKLTELTQAEAEAEAEAVINTSDNTNTSAPEKNTSAQRKKVTRKVDSISWTSDGGWIGICDVDRAAWSIAYPATNLTRELEKANQWLISNPTKAVRRLWRRFVTSWLSRVQDAGGSRQNGSTAFRRDESHIPSDCADNQRHLWWMPDGRTPRKIPIYTTVDGRERYLDGTYA